MFSKHNKKTYKKLIAISGLVTRITKVAEEKMPHQRHKQYKYLKIIKSYF